MPPGDYWDAPECELGPQAYHPLQLAGEDAHALVSLWLEFRGGMGGRGPLPFSGGMADQPALIWSAFSIIAEAWDALNPSRDKST